MSNMTRMQKIKESYGVILSLMLVYAGLFMLYGAMPGTEAQAAGPPQFEDSFAVSSIRPGENWRIFVKGSDPDGDMTHIWVVVSQLGGNMWSNHIIRLKGNESKAFEGYITLPTPHFFPRGGWQYVRVEMKIRDKAGVYSQPRVQELEIGSPTMEYLPSNGEARQTIRWARSSLTSTLIRAPIPETTGSARSWDMLESSIRNPAFDIPAEAGGR